LDQIHPGWSNLAPRGKKWPLKIVFLILNYSISSSFFHSLRKQIGMYVTCTPKHKPSLITNEWNFVEPILNSNKKLYYLQQISFCHTNYRSVHSRMLCFQ
jgi:hypothetical protein